MQRGGAGGATKGTEPLGTLEARGAPPAGGTIDATRAREANAFRNVAGIEAPRDHERQFEIEIFQHMPVEYRAEAAGTCGFPGGTGIEQNTIGNGSIAG